MRLDQGNRIWQLIVDAARPSAVPIEQIEWPVTCAHDTSSRQECIDRREVPAGCHSLGGLIDVCSSLNMRVTGS